MEENELQNAKFTKNIGALGSLEQLSLSEQLRVPKIDKAYIAEQLQLPEQFLGGMTLREGTFVTLAILQSIAFTFGTYVGLWYTLWHEQGDTFWKQKFTGDIDPFYKQRPKEVAYIEALYPYWSTVAFSLIVVHGVYFVAGLGVCLGICFPHIHTCVYWPWLILTALLVELTYLTSFAMLIVLFWLTGQRHISITWDLTPVILVFLYAVGWTYGLRIVLAQFRRRRIVRYWLTHKRKTLTQKRIFTKIQSIKDYKLC